MKIGVFGGSFDPLHKGHIHFARWALKEFNLDRLYFVPVKISPLKKDEPTASAADRVQMIRAALKTEPLFKLETCEIKREGPSYSYLTLRYFKKKFPKAELFFLLGADALKRLKQWKNYKEILNSSTLVSASRKKFPCSSTDIRNKLQTGRSIRKECPSSVCSYIKKNKLYQQLYV